MSLSVRIHNLGLLDLPILNIIQFKLLRMSKMLKNLSVFICYTNSHLSFSFSLNVSGYEAIGSFAVPFAAECICTITKTIISAGNAEYFSMHHTVCQLVTCRFVYFCNRRPGNSHLLCTLFMCTFI